jgi:hypothetical protein
LKNKYLYNTNYILLIELVDVRKIVLFFILIIISGSLSAQSNVQQITFGGGAGVTIAYTSAQVQKVTSAWFADAGYYPVPCFDINIEEQVGSLAGTPLSAHSNNLKSFNNNYHAAILNAELQPVMLFDYQQNDFLNAIKNAYIGAGFGLINNNITNTIILPPHGTAYIKNTLRIIPVKLGYEFNLLNRYGEPVLKIDLIDGFNYTIGKGLDGYYDSYSKGFYFYSYYAIGVRYAFSLVDRSGKRRYKVN